jgi:hypothetical protein
MPELITAAVAAAQAYIGSLTVTQVALYVARAVIAIGFSTALNRREQRKALAASRAAYNASLQDRTVTVSSPIQPVQWIYGMARVGGSFVFKPFSTGPLKEFAHIGIVVSHREITSFDNILFGETPVGLPDADGYLTHPSTVKATRRQTVQVIAGGDVGEYVDLVYVPVAGIQSLSWTAFDAGGGELRAGVHYSLAGRRVTWLEDVRQYQLYANYEWEEVRRFVRVRLYRGAPGQQADPDLIAESSGMWTSAHVGNNQAWAYLRFEYDPDLFATGLPQVSFVVRGHPVLDERTGQFGWSMSPVWCTQDYLMDPDGGGLKRSRVDTQAHIAEANVCDERVSISGLRPGEVINSSLFMGSAFRTASDQPRYTCNGVLVASETPYANIEELSTSFVGGVACVQGRWRIRAGYYRAPTLTIDESFLTGEQLEIVPGPGGDQVFNSVKALFADASRIMTERQSDAVTNQFYVEQDGGRLIEKEIQLTMTNDWFEARRLQRAFLEDFRQSTRLMISCNHRAYDTAWQENVYVNLPWLGYNNKVFQVLDREFSQSGGVRLTLKETSASIWTIAPDQVVAEDLAPNTALQDPRQVPDIENLRVAKELTEMLPGPTLIVRPLLAWDPITNANVTRGGRIQVQQKLADSPEWQQLAPVFGDEVQTRGEPLIDSALHLFRVRAVNGLGVEGRWATVSYRAADWQIMYFLPRIRDFSARIVGQDVVFEWATGGEESGVDEFELRVGLDWESSLKVTGLGAHTHTARVDWVNNRRFWVAARGFDSKFGRAASVDVLIQSPARPAVSAEIVDNNVLLRWSSGETTLPITSYAVEKVAGQGVQPLLVGDNGDGRFAAIFEQQAGEFTYQVRAIDSAGNSSEGGRVTARVSQPPDYVLQDDRNSDWAGTRTNAYFENGVLLAPINTTETYGEHFASRGWLSMANAIDAGADLYFEPAPQQAVYEELIDYGALIPSSTVTVSVTKTDVQGQVDVSIDLAYRAALTDPWVEMQGVSQIVASNFRYLRVRLNLEAQGGNAYCELVQLNMRLSTKLKRESIAVNANAADAGGTAVSFGLGFLDVRSIQATARGTSALIAVVDFQDVPNPAGCRVFVFDRATGNRVSGPVSVDVTGV